MDEKLKATITQRLEDLPDETARQLLDYIEFLESKYNRSTRDRSPFERLADNVEGTLRATRIGEAAIKGTSSVLDAASSVVKGVADAGRVVVEELQKLDLSEPEEGEQSKEGEDTSPEQDEGERSEATGDSPPQGKATDAEETAEQSGPDAARSHKEEGDDQDTEGKKSA
ncbi:MAG: DUF2281 domain-containing protein [Gemmatimonadota bacterium]|nr:MAG: DUF2281 domain-containing protein [Gemmatimonadota bacterium]